MAIMPRKYVTLTIFSTILFAFLFLLVSKPVLADMALPDSYYTGQSLTVLLAIIITDFIALLAVSRWVFKKIKFKLLIAVLIPVVVIGFLGDIFSFRLLNVAHSAIYPATATYHQDTWAMYWQIISPQEFYRLNTYLQNIGLDDPLVNRQPVTSIMLAICAWLTIGGLNFLFSLAVLWHWKDALRWGAGIGFLTNPIWELHWWLLVIWVGLIGFILWYYRGTHKPTSNTAPVASI